MKRAALFTHVPLDVLGGTGRLTEQLLRLLTDEGFDVEIYEPRASNTRLGKLLQPLAQCYALGRRVGRNLGSYNLVVTIGYTAGFLRGSNVICISCGSVQSYYDAIKRVPGQNRRLFFSASMMTLCDRLSKRGKRCIAISPQVKEELARDYGVQSTVVPCGIDTKHFSWRATGKDLRARHGIDPDVTVGLYAGRWDTAHKGLDALISLMRERSDVHWLMAPNSDVRIPGIKRLTVLQDVRFEDLPNLYSAADFSIQLSRYESFGFCLLESLSCSVPALSTPVGIAPQVYNDPLLRNLLVPHPEQGARHSLEEIFGKIDLLKDSSYRTELGRRGRARVEKEFSLDMWRDRMREVIKLALEDRACGL